MMEQRIGGCMVGIGEETAALGLGYYEVRVLDSGLEQYHVWTRMLMRGWVRS